MKKRAQILGWSIRENVDGTFTAYRRSDGRTISRFIGKDRSKARSILTIANTELGIPATEPVTTNRKVRNMLLDKILPSKASEPPAAVQEPPAPSTDERTLIEIAQEYGRYSLPVGPVHAIRDGKCSCGKACDRPGNHPAAPCLQNQGSITYERHATKTVVGGFYGCTDQYGMMRLFSNDDLNIALELGVRTRLAALLVQGESAEKIFFDLVAVHGEIETIQCVSVDRRVLVLAHPPKH